jgi:hypothetical protein
MLMVFNDTCVSKMILGIEPFHVALRVHNLGKKLFFFESSYGV